MSPIPTRPLGSLTVSELSLGGSSIGGRRGRQISGDDALGAATVHKACELGITHIDTSPRYGPSERRIGLALREKDHRELTISTKAGTHPERGGSYAAGDLRWSVENSLRLLGRSSVEIVLIHDGARPWVDSALIGRVLDGTRRWGACIPVVDTSEAPKRIGPSGLILEDLPREQYKLAQTPQGFLYDRILEAHRRAKDSPHLFLDDAEVYTTCWSGVFTVPGDRRNRKLTFKEDLP